MHFWDFHQIWALLYAILDYHNCNRFILKGGIRTRRTHLNIHVYIINYVSYLFNWKWTLFYKCLVIHRSCYHYIALRHYCTTTLLHCDSLIITLWCTLLYRPTTGVQFLFMGKYVLVTYCSVQFSDQSTEFSFFNGLVFLTNAWFICFFVCWVSCFTSTAASLLRCCFKVRN